MSRYWGARIKDVNGVPKDTGVNPGMEELAAILSSESPIELNAPITLVNRTNGPAIHIINAGPNDQTQGIRIENEADQVTKIGIGLGSQNILANSYVPLESASIDPLKAFLFYNQNNALQYKNLEALGKDQPPESPGKEGDQIDPGFTYQDGQPVQPGGEYGGGGGANPSTDARSLAFNLHRIINVNKFFQCDGIADGISDTRTVVSDVTCDAGTLSVTYETWTITNGVIVDIS